MADHDEGNSPNVGNRTSSEQTLSERNVADTEKDAGRKDKDNEKQDYSVPTNFFDSRLHKVRIEVLGSWFLTTLGLMAFILGVLSIYWGALLGFSDNMSSLTAIVVDFDGSSAPYTNVNPIVGPAMTMVAQKSRQAKGTIGWEVRDPAEFNFDPIAVRQYIFDQHAWVAIIVNNNATGLLRAAVENGNTSYDPMGSAQVVFVEARDQETYAGYILPQVSEYQVQVTSVFGQEWVKSVLTNTSLDATTYGDVPQAISPAIGFSTYNLRPFGPPAATPAVSIGLIYLIILAFFSFIFYVPIYSKFVVPDGHPVMHYWELMLWRLGLVLMTYFFLSLAYSLVSLAFQIPFSNDFPHNDVTVANNPDAYGKGSFVVYWMLNWVGMAALGLASENVSMLVGSPYSSLWLIFWVISNVCTGFYPIPLEATFFYWGYAWPLHNIVEASRTILFDTHSRIGLNFGILFAWVAVNIAVYFPSAVFFRWKNTRNQMKESPKPHMRWLLDG